MGRSVSTPHNAEVVCYKDVSSFGYRQYNEDGKESYDSLFDEDQASLDWDFFIDDILDTCRNQWKSLTVCNYWLGDEDHAILENELVYIGVSEYCGCASIWIVPKEDDYTNKVDLAKCWIRQIEKKFKAKFSDLTKLGTFSNGEAIFKKKEG